MQNESGKILLKFSRICCKLHLISRKNFNLTAGELFCLISLIIDKPRCIKELSEKTGIRSTTTSKLLKSLEQRFIIKRELDANDKRIEKVFLTQTGKDFTRKLISFYNNKFSQVTGFATEVQRSLFFDFLNQLSLEAEKLPELHGDLIK